MTRSSILSGKWLVEKIASPHNKQGGPKESGKWSLILVSSGKFNRAVEQAFTLIAK